MPGKAEQRERAEEPSEGPPRRRLRVPIRRAQDRDKNPRSPMARPRFLLLVAFLLALNWFLVDRVKPPEPSVQVPYHPVFLAEVRDENVLRINSRGASITGEFREPVTWPTTGEDRTSARKFETVLPAFTNGTALEELLIDHDVRIDAEPIEVRRGVLATLLLGFGPVVLLVLLIFWFLRRGASGSVGTFGRSRARRVQPGEQIVTFEDVAGIDEAKHELTEVVDFLTTPERYQALGGRMPRGVLLAGQPGTGKTLLARAVAGEAGVPFFSSSASEFVEAIVGVGAARVRDTFRQAKEAAPAIIFIDELDAVGRQRTGGAGFGAGSDEREQTLNQILTEMDGFGTDTTVIVIAATNRPEILDSALLRPGRFDRRVTVPPPDVDGRREILDVHTRAVPLAEDVDLQRLAAVTPGMVGADLANLCNEAALMAARRRHDAVEHRDFTDALEKIILGAPRKMLLSDADRERTAYHEAGHAIVGMLSEGADTVRKVSIIPRGQALGVTFSAPDADRVSYDLEALEAKLDGILGGRVAEELVFNKITTGAQNDIQQATKLARAMVAQWGMSDRVGFLAVGTTNGGSPFGFDAWSEATRVLVDEEARRIVDASHDRVTRLLSRERQRLDSLAHALLEHETLDQDAVYAAAGIERTPLEVLDAAGS